MKKDVVIIIPSYNPDYNLINVEKELRKNEYSNIVIVNDGSYSDDIFKSLENNAIILTHSINMGKGEALKSAFKYCINNFDDIKGVITLDDDAQHEIEDVNNIYLNTNNNVILGSRNFNDGKIPLKSKIGNKCTSKIIKLFTGIKINDTQTGLRFIPYKYLKDFINIDGKGFEYETNMILYSLKNNINIEEIPIYTFYLENNIKSIFHPVKDSIAIAINVLKHLKEN